MPDLTAIAQSAPGPIAVNTAILLVATGWAGRWAALSILGDHSAALSYPVGGNSLFYTAFRENRVVAAVLKGMQAGVPAVIASVVMDMGGDILRRREWLPTTTGGRLSGDPARTGSTWPGSSWPARFWASRPPLPSSAGRRVRLDPDPALLSAFSDRAFQLWRGVRGPPPHPDPGGDVHHWAGHGGAHRSHHHLPDNSGAHRHQCRHLCGHPDPPDPWAPSWRLGLCLPLLRHRLPAGRVTTGTGASPPSRARCTVLASGYRIPYCLRRTFSDHNRLLGKSRPSRPSFPIWWRGALCGRLCRAAPLGSATRWGSCWAAAYWGASSICFSPVWDKKNGHRKGKRPFS